MMMVAFSKRTSSRKGTGAGTQGEKLFKETVPKGQDGSWDNGPVTSLLENWPRCWGDAGEGQESLLEMGILLPGSRLSWKF